MSLPAVVDVARVMVCDDSAVIRSAISRILESDPGIKVISRVGDGAQALASLKKTAVDVVVLDIEMPVMDGLTALPLLLQQDPGLRIIMASTLTTRGADIALQALKLGAADYLPKPTTATLAADSGFGSELVAKVKGLTRFRRPPAAAPVASASAVLSPPLKRRASLLAIGSSTGGPQALFTLVQALGPKVGVPVVLTQHMPATFTPLLAQHLTKLGGMPCTEAQNGEMLRPDRIYLAPGDFHLLVMKSQGGLMAKLSSGAAENVCRPAVDPMLRSAAVACDGAVLVVMLTGMGQDGMLGTQDVVRGGGAAIAQDAETSVVWGMPGAVVRAGLAHAVLPLDKIASKVTQMLVQR